MTSAIGIKKIKHLNGTNALTVNAAGVITFDQKLVSASTDSSTFAGRIVANAGITAYGNVGIGNSNPNYLLKVGPVNTTETIAVQSAGGGAETIMQSVSGTDSRVGSSANTPLNLITNNVSRMTIDTSGRVTMPYQPAFRVTNAPATAALGTLVYANAPVNIGAHYNTSNGRFTAPVAGHYLFTMSMLFPTTGTSYARILFAVNGVASTLYADTLTSAGTSYLSLNGSAVIGLSAGDYVTVVNNGLITSYGAGYGSFCGYLIG